jgi:hypothetical protein
MFHLTISLSCFSITRYSSISHLISVYSPQSSTVIYLTKPLLRDIKVVKLEFFNLEFGVSIGINLVHILN